MKHWEGFKRRLGKRHRVTTRNGLTTLGNHDTLTSEYLRVLKPPAVTKCSTFFVQFQYSFSAISTLGCLCNNIQRFSLTSIASYEITAFNELDVGMSNGILAFPPELFDAVLVQLPPASLQQTLLSFTRALPRSPIPVYHLFRNIRLKHPDQAVQLYRRLRGTDDSKWVLGFYLDTWTVDADVVVNVMHLLSRLTQVNLCIGPNFAPEHVQEIFQDVRPDLRLVSLRFRP